MLLLFTLSSHGCFLLLGSGDGTVVCIYWFYNVIALTNSTIYWLQICYTQYCCAIILITEIDTVLLEKEFQTHCLIITEWLSPCSGRQLYEGEVKHIIGLNLIKLLGQAIFIINFLIQTRFIHHASCMFTNIVPYV